MGLMVFHKNSAHEINQNRTKHEKNIDRFSPRIKKQAEKHQNPIADFPRAKIIGRQHKRQKNPQKKH